MSQSEFFMVGFRKWIEQIDENKATPTNTSKVWPISDSLENVVAWVELANILRQRGGYEPIIAVPASESLYLKQRVGHYMGFGNAPLTADKIMMRFWDISTDSSRCDKGE